MPQHQLYGLRGKAYVVKYKQLYEELKDVIKEDVLEVKKTTGLFTAYDFGKLCVKHRIPLTAMDDYLNSIFVLILSQATLLFGTQELGSD